MPNRFHRKYNRTSCSDFLDPLEERINVIKQLSYNEVRPGVDLRFQIMKLCLAIVLPVRVSIGVGCGGLS